MSVTQRQRFIALWIHSYDVQRNLEGKRRMYIAAIRMMAVFFPRGPERAKYLKEQKSIIKLVESLQDPAVVKANREILKNCLIEVKRDHL